MFYVVVDALGQMRNETERVAAAMAVFDVQLGTQSADRSRKPKDEGVC
jgi:hypothetical protein